MTSEGRDTKARRRARRLCAIGAGGGCAPHRASVMGYHDAREIPSCWAHTRDFDLEDHMFATAASWSLPTHLLMVSEWTARCARPGHP